MKPEEYRYKDLVKELCLAKELNTKRLTPLQWRGIMNAMEEYAKQYALSLLPSDEEIENENISLNYENGKKDLKKQIINKLS